MRTVVLVLVLAGVVAAAASAAPGDPRQRHTPAGAVTAHDALLRHSDLKGWKATAATPAKPSKVCKGLRPNLSSLVETGYAQSPDFRLGQQGSISQSVRVFRKPAGASAAYARTVTIGLPDCLGKQLEAASNAKSTIRPTGEYRLGMPKVTKRTAGFRVVATAKTPDAKFDVYADVVVIARGSTVTTVTFTGLAQPVDRGLEQRLVRTIAQRLGAKPTAA